VRWEIEQPFVASCFRNICAKNRQNPLIPFKVTIDNVGVPFFETQSVCGNMQSLTGFPPTSKQTTTYDCKLSFYIKFCLHAGMANICCDICRQVLKNELR